MDNSDLLTPKQLAERWGVKEVSLGNQRYAGRGPAYIKPGGKVLYRLADVIAYEEASVTQPGSRPRAKSTPRGAFR